MEPQTWTGCAHAAAQIPRHQPGLPRQGEPVALLRHQWPLDYTEGGVRVTLTTFFTAMAKPGGAAHEGCAAQLERIDLLTSGFCGI